MTDEYIWPARNVAEYAYCPRLFYLMEVEGIHLPSEDTESGNAVHKRVDKPSAELESTREEAERPAVARSLTLTSERLGLTATLDLAEVAGQVAVPVEYRKGKPRRGSKDDEPEPWPTDRIQVTMQAMLLEEAGYRVERGVLYYAAEKRRLDLPLTDTLRTEAVETLREARACAAAGRRPQPLLNDRRCEGCSLQPFCLPDEINYLNTPDPPEELTPRRMWPPRDDGLHIIVQSQRSRVSVRGEEIMVMGADDSTAARVSLTAIESVSLLGTPQISTQALHALTAKGIPVAWMTFTGRMLAMIDPLDSVSAETRRAQVRRFDNPDDCLELSRALIAAKISNQRTLVLRNHPEPPPSALEQMAHCMRNAAEAESLDSLRGHEGLAAAVYFSLFGECLRSDTAESFRKNGRKRRPAPDPVNCCLSMAYSMLTHECTAALRLARLEPSIGAFHVSRPGRPALSLDLMELFRPLIADSIALSAFNRNELREGHFFHSAAGCVFTDHGRKAFFEAYGRRMETMISHPVLEYRLSYRRMIRLHARMVAAWLLGEIRDLCFLTTR